MIKRLLILLLLCICINAYSQNSYATTYQSWTRVELRYKKENTLLIQNFDNRFDWKTSGYINQARTEIMSAGDNEVQAGGGITIRNNEFRLRERVNYDIHQLILEQRLFNNFTILRLRYMVYPEIKINESNRINVGIETMVQGFIGNRLTPSETRIMFDFSQINKNNIVRVGYMACIFRSVIIHSFRVTAIINYGDK
jgi:hypothetical protein